MENKYLFIYSTLEDEIGFEWFDTEEELRSFKHNSHILLHTEEALFIEKARYVSI